MKYVLVLLLATSSCAFAQEGPRTTIVYQSAGAGVMTGIAGKAFRSPVQGAPYSATITNESVQTLADGNRIVQNSGGTTARDSEGRTRQDTALPAIGNLSAANAPHIVFILDPVAQTSYTLNLTDKTAQKFSMPPGATAGVGGVSTGPGGGGKVFFAQVAASSAAGGPLPPPPGPIAMQKIMIADEQAQVSTEDLGSQTMEGLLVTGVRTTRTIPAGEIGNEKPFRLLPRCGLLLT